MKALFGEGNAENPIMFSDVAAYATHFSPENPQTPMMIEAKNTARRFLINQKYFGQRMVIIERCWRKNLRIKLIEADIFKVMFIRKRIGPAMWWNSTDKNEELGR